MTNKAAVLGKPIAHSLSPAMHNAAYRALGYNDWEYGRVEVDEDGLEEFLDSLDPEWHGLSLTMPLKKTIMEYGVPCDDMVETLGVANTAVLQWVELGEDPDDVGCEIELYNTDVFGIVQALRESDPGVEERARARDDRGVVLGSGSTAASALAALSQLGVTRVTVGARHPEKVVGLEPLAARLGLSLDPVVLDSDELVTLLPQTAVTVSALPAHAADALAARLGAAADRGSVDLSASTLLDVTYDPSPTDLMRAWRSAGADGDVPRAVGGEEMLLWQGVRQVELMTGTPRHAVPVDAMRTALMEGLGR